MDEDPLSLEQQALEKALHEVWRKRFHQTVPVKDHVEMLRSILLENGVSEETIDKAIVVERHRLGLT